jgi:hypothetical protein
MACPRSECGHILLRILRAIRGQAAAEAMQQQYLLAMVQTSVHGLHGMVMDLWWDYAGLDRFEDRWTHGGTPAISAININWADVHATGYCRRPSFDSTGPVYKGHFRLSDNTS